MKKVFVFVFSVLVFMLLIAGVVAVGEAATTSTEPGVLSDSATGASAPASNIDPNTGLPIVDKQKLGDVAKNAGNQTVSISPELQLAARVLFGLKQDAGVSFNLLIVIIVILGCVATLLYKIIRFLPFLKEEWTRWGVAIIVTLLASSSGAFIVMASYLFGFGDNIKFLKDWHLLNVALVVIILGLFAWGVNKLLGKMEEKSKNVSLENTARDAAMPRELVKKN